MSDNKIVLTKQELETTIRKMAREHLNEQSMVNEQVDVVRFSSEFANSKSDEDRRAVIQRYFPNASSVGVSKALQHFNSRAIALAKDAYSILGAYNLDARVAEAFDKALESVDPSDTDALIEAMTNEIFGFGGYGGKDRERIEPNVDRKFGDMKEKLGVAVKQFMRDRANPAKRKMASQVIHGMIGKRGNPSQILKSMTDLGLKADEVWAEILGDVGARM